MKWGQVKCLLSRGSNRQESRIFDLSLARSRAWENHAEIRWVIKDTCGIDLPPPPRKTIDLEGRIVKDGIRKALRNRQLALAELVHAIREYRRIEDSKPLTLQGSAYAHSVHERNKAIGRAEGFLL